LKEQDLIKLLSDARDAYYNTDSPILADAEFDRLEEELRDLNPESPYFSTVGVQVEESKKITHTEPMLSMGKAKSPQEVFKWIDKLSLQEDVLWTIQPKIDGLSASCFYSGGKLRYVATRGDGMVGQDVTTISEYIQDIPMVIETEQDIEIRGELYLPKNTEYDTGGRPLRNNCVGLINRKERGDDLKYVRFVCYQTARWNPSKSEAGIIDWLKEKGFHTVEYFSIRSREEMEKLYNRYLETLRDSWLYETDGLIMTVDDNTLHSEIDNRWVVDHHHHYAIAIKPPSASKVTTLTGVEWQVSRQGALVPVALFEPVQLGGANLARASLHNYAFVEAMALQLGDKLVIERANDVIPYVRENLSSALREGELFLSNLTPDSCPVCHSDVLEEGVHLKCTNLDCPERHIQTILYWVKESGMEQVAEATIRQLYEKNIIRNVSDMYKITSIDLEGLEGFGEKKIKNFLTQLEKVRTMPAPALISKLGIPLVQQKALKKLGIHSMNDFMTFDDDTFVTGQNIITWKNNSENISFLKDLLNVVKVEDVDIKETKGQVCMTGKGPLGRKELQKIIEEKGYEFSSSVTKNTSILLCEDPGGSSSKLQKARQNGVDLISYEDFLKE